MSYKPAGFISKHDQTGHTQHRHQHNGKSNPVAHLSGPTGHPKHFLPHKGPRRCLVPSWSLHSHAPFTTHYNAVPTGNGHSSKRASPRRHLSSALTPFPETMRVPQEPIQKGCYLRVHTRSPVPIGSLGILHMLFRILPRYQ